MTRPLALLAAAVASVVTVGLLAGCTADTDDGTAPSTSASAAPSSDGSADASSSDDARTTERVAAPPAPRPKACYRLTFEQLTVPSNDSEPVPCTRRHDAQTIHVGRLDTVVDGHSLAVDSERVRRQLARTCPRKLAEQVGGTTETRNLSRFEVVWFSPTLEQADRGADWFRCDLVAIAAGDVLFPLPPRPRVAGVLDRPGALATYGLCGTAEPGTPTFERVICARRHSWRAISTIALPGAERYPGTARVRSAGDSPCRDTARDQAADPLQFEYGWEWPSAKQWDNGQRFGYCWAPD